MTLVQCIQDQASFYRKLVSELKVETKVETELEEARQKRRQIERDIEIKKAEIIQLEENS